MFLKLKEDVKRTYSDKIFTEEEIIWSYWIKEPNIWLTFRPDSEEALLGKRITDNRQIEGSNKFLTNEFNNNPDHIKAFEKVVKEIQVKYPSAIASPYPVLCKAKIIDKKLEITFYKFPCN